MRVGAVGGYSFSPYIYNTNSVSSASLGKVQGIGNDLLSSKTDFSALTQEENINPLRKGESLDFAGIIGMQLQMSRMNEARVMKDTTVDESANLAAGVKDATENNKPESVSPISSLTAVEEPESVQAGANAYDYAKAMAAYQPIDLFA